MNTIVCNHCKKIIGPDSDVPGMITISGHMTIEPMSGHGKAVIPGPSHFCDPECLDAEMSNVMQELGK